MEEKSCLEKQSGNCGQIRFEIQKCDNEGVMKPQIVFDDVVAAVNCNIEAVINVKK